MAYATLVSLAQTIDKLLNHDQDSLHEKQHIKSLHEHVIFFQEFFDDFPEKLAKNLEARIRDVTNEAEDIVESFMSEEIRSCLELAENQPGLRFRYDLQKLNQELQKITKEIDSVVGEVTEIKNSPVAGDLELSDSTAATPSSRLPPTSKDAMVGFDDNLMAIKERLCGESSNLQVIPIVGMGGIGKTTLAKNGFDDPLIMEHFDVRAWITVSQHYSAREIFSGLLNSIGAGRSGESNESQMAEYTYKWLKGRRYLIVMDDMWSTKAWDDIRHIFPEDSNGSRIIFTTRLHDVAIYPNPSSALHEMCLLGADQSWNLLEQKVFMQENCPPELQCLGKTIAKSCRGLPLAIVVIAGLLSTASKTRASWEHIASNFSRAIATNDGEFAKVVLSLSYNHLPHRLRPCFLYMGSFPEDYEFRVSKLIKIWVAEGFLRPSGSKSLEEVAEEYLEDLVKRSLVMVTRRKADGKIKRCNVHDLIRDMCITKAIEEKFLFNQMSNTNQFSETMKNCRRVSYNFEPDNIESICGSSVRTIISFEESGNLIGFSVNFELLRVLNVVTPNEHILEYLMWFSVPHAISKLFHLRFLAIVECFEIPAAISILQNLQTFIIYPRGEIISYPRREVRLPKEIWRMPQLRHVVLFTPRVLPDPEEATFCLENLQTLSGVTNFMCPEEILKMIPNLKKLGIVYVEIDFHARDPDFIHKYITKAFDKLNLDFHLDNLVHLNRLEKLKLVVFRQTKGPMNMNPIFPTSLKKLVLSGWGLPWEDLDRIASSLPNLEVLKLRNYACDGAVWETSEGQFPQLKFLLINKIKLMRWTTESSHFPRLKCLVLYDCDPLFDLPDSIGEISTLEVIEVCEENPRIVRTAERVKQEQQQMGNDALQVRVVSYFDKRR